MSKNEAEAPLGGKYQFWVSGPTWFIAPFPRPTDPAELVRGIRQMGIETASGKEGTVIPLFSDLDLAERFVAKLDDGDKYKPLTCDSNLGIAAILAELMKLGETHVLFDPEPTFDPRRMFSIYQVIRGIAEARGVLDSE